jgi:hypothetical protein
LGRNVKVTHQNRQSQSQPENGVIKKDMNLQRSTNKTNMQRDQLQRRDKTGLVSSTRLQRQHMNENSNSNSRARKELSFKEEEEEDDDEDIDKSEKMEKESEQIDEDEDDESENEEHKKKNDCNEEENSEKVSCVFW